MVEGWMFGGAGYHTTSKGLEFSYELDYAILLCPGILSAFFRNIRISWKYPHSVDIIHILWIYQNSVDFIKISWKYPRYVDIIQI